MKKLPIFYAAAGGLLAGLAAFLLLGSSAGVTRAQATRTIPIRAGWNLVSSPAGTLVMSQLNTDCGFSSDNGPFWYDGTGYQTLVIMEAMKGYWLFSNKNCTIQVTGVDSPQTAALHPGWNMISSSQSWNEIQLGCQLAAGPFSYNGSDYAQAALDQPLDDSQGYWVNVTSDCALRETASSQTTDTQATAPAAPADMIETPSNSFADIDLTFVPVPSAGLGRDDSNAFIADRVIFNDARYGRVPIIINILVRKSGTDKLKLIEKTAPGWGVRYSPSNDISRLRVNGQLARPSYSASYDPQTGVTQVFEWPEGDYQDGDSYKLIYYAFPLAENQQTPTSSAFRSKFKNDLTFEGQLRYVEAGSDGLPIMIGGRQTY